jgi:putative ABC transport system ATP-binding protein
VGNTLLQAQNLDKAYGKGASRFEALRNINLEVHRGESLAIIGKSGSGKSTLMHILALLDRPDSGSILIDGEDAAKLPSRDIDKLRNERFGFVFQQFFLTANETVLENVVLPLTIAGVSSSERRKRGMAALEQLGLADKAKNRATDLSGGQKQRVVIARALIGAPDVIFADEPTGNLDSNTGQAVEDLLFSLNKEQGITLVIVTHDPDLAARCDRSITVADGSITASNSTTNTTADLQTGATA